MTFVSVTLNWLKINVIKFILNILYRLFILFHNEFLQVVATLSLDVGKCKQRERLQTDKSY